MSELLGWYSDRAECCPERAALIIDGERVSYARLQESILYESKRLRRSGIGPGRCVVLDRRPSSEPWVVGLLASLAAGASPVLIDNSWPTRRKRDSIAAFQPAATLAGVADLHTPHLCAPAPHGESGGDAPPGVWLFTSGTTGPPKALFRSSHQLENMVARVRSRLPGEVVAGVPAGLGIVPFHHGYGLINALLLNHALGGTVVLERRFRPRRAVARMREHAVRLLFGTPAHFQALARPNVWGGGGAALLWCVNSTGRLDAEIARRFARLSGCPIREQYGATETGPLCLDAEMPPSGLEGCVGRPLPGVCIDVRDGNGTPLPRGRAGQLAVRFADGSTPEIGAIADGFFYTGDIGALDEADRVLLHRRAAGPADVDGRRLPCDLISQVLGSHPAVTSVRIKPPSNTSGRFRVSVDTCHPVDPDDLRSYCRLYLTTAEMRFDLRCQAPPD